VAIFCLTLLFVPGLWANEGRVLERSMKGPDVVELQKNLNSLGYQVAVDGYFGTATENAVRAFQQDNGLTADGIVGPETLRAMRTAGQNQVHIVGRGDCLSELALRYGSTVEAIMDANDLTDDLIYIGQKLIIPPASKQGQTTNDDVGKRPATAPKGRTAAMATYRVKKGESLYTIARKFRTTEQAIVEANNIKNPSRIRVGQSLLIPATGGLKATRRFRWPVKGPISSGYGWRIHPIYKNRQFHAGIDIAVPTGTLVRAAEKGKVIKAKNMGGFGLGVVIDHGNGITSWYGHNSVLLVKPGERVVRGQVIAKSGSTGVSTGPHLDFRIKVNGTAVNPRKWLQ